MASTVSNEKAGNEDYQTGHMGLIFKEGFSFSGFERDNLHLNLQGKRFKDISGVSGADSISDGRSAVLADLDNDGDLDIFLTTIQNQGHLLFRNNIGQDNNYLRVTLEGTASGKDAFGAIVRVRTSHGVQTRVKSGSEGFLAQHDPRLLFGLGKDEQVQWLEIAWTSGKTTRLGPIPAGKSVKVVEGETGFQTVAERSIRLPDPLSRQQAVWRSLKIQKGDRFPQLKMKRLGKGDRLEEGRLKPGVSYFVNLWATWCLPCRKEMPELQRLLPRFREKGIQVIGVSIDQAVDPEVGPDAVKAVAAQLGVGYPLYLMEDLEQIFREQVEIPLSILVDDEGRVVDVYSGGGPESERRILDLVK